MSAVTVLEGVVDVRRHADGRVEIVSAPPTARINLSFLRHSDPALVTADANTIVVAGQVTYRVVGWDPRSSCLLAELVKDLRGVAGG